MPRRLALQQVTSLRELCISRILALASSCDKSSMRMCKSLLLEIFGIKVITKCAFASPAALRGLKYLDGPKDKEWDLVDACRNYMATVNDARRSAAMFHSVESSLRAMIDVRKDNQLAEICDDIAQICRAFLGNDRYKRDMKGNSLPKLTADRCRALRNLADAKCESLRVNSPFQHRDTLRRHQSLRKAAVRTSSRHPTVGPWFPGYEH